MPRVGAVFIALCMVAIAASVGGVAFLGLGLSAAEAAATALAMLAALVLLNALTHRRKDGGHFERQVEDLSRGTGDLARQVGEIGRRLATIESRGDGSAERVREATTPLSSELSELSTLVRQLAETVAAQDSRIATALARPALPPAASLESASAAAFRASEAGDGTGAMERLASVGQDAMTATIRGAVEASRIDLYLQPIVTLPQRKVRYYEALSRLRTDDGQMLLPADFLIPADNAGLLSRIDNLLLFRSVQVIRRLLLKNRDVGLFCNVSVAMLNDPLVFPQVVGFLEANRALAPSLILELRQDVWRSMGPLEQEALATLRDLGFRFCMDQVSDLRIEPRDLAERGIRFLKAPADLLLGTDRATGADIHPADLSDLLGRYGVSLIADRVENESQIVDLLDYDLRFGQGFLFSPPRPVRQEALQTETVPEAVSAPSPEAAPPPPAIRRPGGGARDADAVPQRAATRR